MFIASLFTIDKLWKQLKPQVSIDRQTDQEVVIHTMEYCAAIKR